MANFQETRFFFLPRLVDIYIIFAVNSETESKRLIFCVETLCLPPWSSPAASEIFLQEEEVTTAPKASKQSDTPLKKKGETEKKLPKPNVPTWAHQGFAFQLPDR